jgi:hypothetical protein
LARIEESGLDVPFELFSQEVAPGHSFLKSPDWQRTMVSLNLPRKPVVVAICLVAAALHLVTGPDYAGPFRAFVTGYLIDLVLPFSLVLLLGVGLASVPVLGQPLARAGLVIGIGVIVEGSQYLGIPLFGRTFDPLDLLMYVAGAAAAVGFERLAFPAHSPPHCS